MKKWLALFALTAAALSAQTAETIPFRAVLLPSNEVPPVNINASGAATVWLHVVRDAQGRVTSASTDFNVSYQFPGEIRFTGLHIHRGRAGENGPVLIDSGIRATEPIVSATGRGVIDMQGQTLASNAAGLEAVNGVLSDPSGFYVNLHSTENPGGVIRGQLERAEMVVLMGIMSPANEIPAVSGLNVTAPGAVIAIATCGGTPMRDCAQPTSGQVIFDAAYTSGFPEGTAFTGFHIHAGNSTVNGPVTINTGMQGGANALPANTSGGVHHYEVEVPVANAAAANTLAGLFRNPQDYYINLHTVANPGGAVRAQLRNTDKMQFHANLSPANEVPAITGFDASAPSVTTIHTIRNAEGTVAAGVAIFDVNYRFPGEDNFTGLHIHNGRAGVNGPVTIDSGLSATRPVRTPTGHGNIYRIVHVNNATGLQTLNSVVANPEAHYVNLHTTSRPGGAVRAQLSPANDARPTISAVISSISDPTLRTVAPGGLMTIFGSNFTKAMADIASSFNGAQLPTAFNGTQVTVGGRVAPILMLDPGFIVVQVPIDSAQGNQSVVVRNANGEVATAGTVTVSNLAPGLYFDANGGVFTKADYSYVDRNNQARPGDLIWAYGTGFGTLSGRAGAPRLNTGDLAGRTALYDTAPVTLTVGGRVAEVLASVASPGYAGLNQILFRVPEGVSGNSPVVATIGGVRSNSVNLNVR